MNLLFHQLNQRKAYLEHLLSDITRGLELSPQGKLRVSNDRGIPRYYWITNSKDTHGKYISKKELEQACQLAQKDYMQKLYQKVKEELGDINTYLKNHGKTDLEDVYTSLNDYRKSIVMPMVISDDMFVKKWEDEQYETNPYFPEEKVYPTKKDELVRSKSEVLLADMYYELGVPYRYEARLQLKSGKKKYPDFTVLKVNTREVIYHEHLGLLDDEEYRKANLVKIEEYRNSGIYLGKNLIITYEGTGCPLNIKGIRKMVQEILL